ncbi:hypothetical protein SAMN05660860_00436 [Geoalkalibacter ferrihydriticus]|uniref:Uncharacterized protein n=2 Tax=Geoalkalibacter ferrihydriticus TaxID=392333 RepID=A0A0C2HWA8_9BACT|nr:hypothetical protein [Geoalkalibacter ferrihydriticus]KIH77067.1 hypothetical protein GFER_08515 [Geoalkalibacter ferrihydriticus DSM 17813]SDL36313.1 hypothetical protein SAMN05660860_00436 [Geoalkalibacter ferrihydriticus]
MAREIRRIFALAATRRTLRGGRAPGCAQRRLARSLAGLQQVRRACAWLAALTRERPRLRPAPLWGTGLCRMVQDAAAAAQESAPPTGRRRSSVAEEAQGRKQLLREIPAPPGPMRVPPAHAETAHSGRRAQHPAIAPSRLVSQAPPELLQRLVHPRQQTENFATTRSTNAVHRDDASRRISPEKTKAPSPQPLSKTASGPGGAPFIREESKVTAWRRQTQARVRHSLHSAVQPAAATRTARGYADPEISIPSQMPRLARPEPEARKASPHHPEGLDPWRQTIGGQTLSSEKLAALATGTAEQFNQTSKPAAQRPAQGGPSQQAAATNADRASAGQPVAIKRAPGHEQPSAAPPVFFDGPLREMLHRANQQSERTGSFLNAAPPRSGQMSAPRNSSEEHSGSEDFSVKRLQPIRHEGTEDDLEQLAEQVQRILQDQARRHGIDL